MSNLANQLYKMDQIKNPDGLIPKLCHNYSEQNKDACGSSTKLHRRRSLYSSKKLHSAVFMGIGLKMVIWQTFAAFKINTHYSVIL